MEGGGSTEREKLTGGNENHIYSGTYECKTSGIGEESETGRELE